MNLSAYTARALPICAALIILAAAGMFLLERAERQARDTTRKHHIEDIEQSLYFARGLHGTYPPYGEPTWCGVLSSEENSAVLAQVEAALRAQHEKYANPAKPFPGDPLQAGTDQDYYYWKHSPASFELFAVLEEDPNQTRSASPCEADGRRYDYGITSVWREA